jgi:PAS domain S-box-containing protein
MEPSPYGGLVTDWEERLRRCESSLVRLLDASSDGILIHRNLRYIYANPAALKLVGRTREEVIGHSPFELVPPRFRMLLAERIMEAYTTRAPMPEIEERLLHASGAEVPVEVVVVPVAFAGDVATLVHVRDITARRELEVRLRAADRLASAGLIAAGVAHEIGNPLTYALSNVELLEERVREGCAQEKRELLELIGSIRDGIERAGHVARDVSVFTSPLHGKPAAVDIHRVLRSTLAFLGPEMRSRANVIQRFGDVPPVLANESRLAQVFLNLLTNAVQSLSSRSRGPNDITITTRPSNGSVVVEVEDTGVGVPRELHCPIFEPLFTTKPDGTGLGLALSKELLAKEGGAISVESTEGIGTKFTVVLPAAPRQPVQEERQPRERSSGLRILIVDDEPRVAASLALILANHHTSIASSGHEALQRIHSGESFDVVLCDLLMEKIDGIDLYRRIHAEHPDLASRMIFLTGDAFISRTQQFLSSVPNRHIQKPFDPETLLDAIDDAVEAKAKR